ncbi:hypothetical protein QFZ20_002062 [Flavobacterium sp. W4I14]|nr:hypothetical protein [Flavobacterium sp. W4I14]
MRLIVENKHVTMQNAVKPAFAFKGGSYFNQLSINYENKNESTHTLRGNCHLRMQ